MVLKWFSAIPAIVQAVKTPEGLIALFIMAITMVILAIVAAKHLKPAWMAPFLTLVMVGAVIVLCSLLIAPRPISVVAGKIAVDRNGQVSVSPQVGGRYSARIEKDSGSRVVVIFEPAMLCAPNLEILATGQEPLRELPVSQEGGANFAFIAPVLPVQVQFVAVCR